ncbi:hypothetical protein CO038_03435 [Candidatus Pacearchaeota archaeon CG_4_9_14_0_2_um_filter_39_13]|nr:hypothetical protein [Candidatus Pacearchaeota archaeon]OIO44045.1 MAG: hypothetical protein AUJ64_00835 [Candidatus Pacearchaeota archaeon CG1_02_39_14]PJC44513.1 MAG: hypothetical protein CO038_03435 [Candidatus Pacearchaeota archaeon CG_4_9_14_0_2_um_filter_39_13]QBM01509.1 hypothetical protein [uncultured archaeon]
MKRSYFFVLYGLLLATIIITVVNFAYFLEVSSSLGNSFTTHATSQGTLSLFVESNETLPPAPDGGTGGGGGGGGGGGSSGGTEEIVGFGISPEEFNLFLTAGELDFREFTISNTGQSELVLDLEISGIVGLATLSKNRITLGPDEYETIALSLIAPQPGIYTGKVIVRAGNIRRDLFVVMNVRSEKVLFDVSLSVPESLRIISSGEFLRVFISLLQVGDAEEVDVTVNYLIKDFDGGLVYTETETFRVIEEKSFVKDFPTASLAPGEYVAGIEVIYPEGFAVSSSHFTIRPEKEFNKPMIATGALAALALLVIVYALIRYKRSGRPKSGRKR